MAHFWLRTGWARRREYKFENLRAFSGDVFSRITVAQILLAGPLELRIGVILTALFYQVGGMVDI